MLFCCYFARLYNIYVKILYILKQFNQAINDTFALGLIKINNITFIQHK